MTIITIVMLDLFTKVLDSLKNTGTAGNHLPHVCILLEIKLLKYSICTLLNILNRILHLSALV